MQGLILLAGPIFRKKLVCHYDSLSEDTPGKTHLGISQIDPHLCTHLIYSYVGIDDTGSLDIIPTDIPKFQAFNALKESYPQLQTFLEVNLMLDIPALLTTITTPQGRRIFIDSTANILQTYQFDGLNIFWMNRKNYQAVNPHLFSELIEELSATGIHLTASVSAEESVIDDSYEFQAIADKVDFFNVVTAGIDINFVSDPSDTLFQKTKSAMEYLVSKGAPKRKLIVGIAAFGRAFALTPKPDGSGLGPDKTAPLLGYFSDTPGRWAYSELCHHTSATKDKIANAWVGYESMATIAEKAKYIREQDFEGAFVMSINLDDFSGKHCHQGNYPVIQKLHEKLNA
uniref:acidic mammalian chitinase-like n=1 Tax=Doryrhamphus excisus TaxID=161450 RepID=UPI0025ADFD00|nr:acidic mammalian chitinase-like [Doryrhamphus excisus]